MARTPSMTRQEAEAAIGFRGAVTVTSGNRGLLKNWLVACGIPSIYAGTLTLATMQGVYNDVTDRELARLRQAAIDDGVTVDGAEDDAEAPAPAPALDDAFDGEARARKLLAAIGDFVTPKAQPLDADAVREIIRKELHTLTPARRLEIKIADKVRDLGTLTHKALPTALQIVAACVPLMLVGPAGSGKTTTCEQIAAALDLPFYMTGAVSGSHEFLGFVDAHSRYQTTPFRQAFEHGGVFLCDEIDGSQDAAPLLVINAALANGAMSFPDRAEPVKRHADFRMIAAANTYGRGADRQYVGRTQLDAATLDRFAVLDFDYDATLEKALAASDAWCARVQAIRAAVEHHKARLIVSPRASINGARLIAAGMAASTVEDAVIWKGCDAEQRRRIDETARANTRAAA